MPPPRPRLSALLLAVFCCCAPALATITLAQRLVVHFESVRSAEGPIRLGFYQTPADWQAQKSNFQRHGYKEGLADGHFTLVFDDVPPGRYAVAVVDDENDSGVIDWGWLLPKEGFGFSNHASRGLRKPAFEDFDFEHVVSGETVVVVRLRYL